MNRIKRERPFIDLLKPETDAVLPVVFALCNKDDVLSDDMLDVVQTAAKLTSAAIRRSTGLLTTDGRGSVDEETRQSSEETEAPWNAAAADFVDIMSHAFQMPAEAGSEEAVRRLLEETEVRFRRGLDPVALDIDDSRKHARRVESDQKRCPRGVSKARRYFRCRDVKACTAAPEARPELRPTV